MRFQRFLGRTAIHEVMTVDGEMRRLIMKSRNTDEIGDMLFRRVCRLFLRMCAKGSRGRYYAQRSDAGSLRDRGQALCLCQGTTPDTGGRRKVWQRP